MEIGKAQALARAVALVEESAGTLAQAHWNAQGLRRTSKVVSPDDRILRAAERYVIAVQARNMAFEAAIGPTKDKGFGQ